MPTASRLLPAITALLFIIACSPGAATPTSAPAAPTAAAVGKPTTAAAAQPTAASKPAAAVPVSGEIVVFAASSLTDVFQDMAKALGVAYTPSFATVGTNNTIMAWKIGKDGAVTNGYAMVGV